MGYQALYRKFRPKTFDDVFGQEHITTILKNQILNDNIAHAYLFSGTRGTGKTSTAKIFARAVNCTNLSDGSPCNKCDICNGILQDNIMDVVEMDAASNNSVDDIRELREKVKYPPSKGRYKVYIIDEVHMLSKGAFNALLKTLEEPPKYLLFILATTEPERLPATILSRCQRFDFKRLSISDIIKNMESICNELSIDVEDKALNLIARNSDGAMRDALSILDQCVSFTDGAITHDYVLSVLGTVNNDMIFNVVDNLIDEKLDEALQSIEEIIQLGKDINQFIKNLILHFRNIMITKTSNNPHDIIECTDETINRLEEQSKNVSVANIVRIINILSEAERDSKWSSQPRIILETSIIKIVASDLELSVESLVHRIEKIEETIKNGNIVKKDTTKNKKVKRDKNSNTKTVKKRKQIKTTVKETSSISNKNKKNKPKLSSSELNINNILKIWTDIMKNIKREKISLHALLIEGKPIEFKNNLLKVGFKKGFGFHRDAVDKENNKSYIENIVSNYLGTDVKIKFVMGDKSITQQSKKNSNEDSKRLVDKAKSIFGDELVEVEE